MSKVFGPVTMRPQGDKWWALNKREQGYGSYGYVFDFLGDALDRFELRLDTWGVDRHGLYVMAVPVPG